MISSKSVNKKFKGLLTILKVLVLLASIWLIYQEFVVKDKFRDLLEFLTGDEPINLPLFAIAFGMNLINWSAEALKWKLLIRSYEDHSYLVAMKSVLSGLFIGFFTPNRIGEFAGRIIYVKANKKVEAALLNLAGGIAQNLVTLLFGFTALISLEINDSYSWAFWSLLGTAGLSLLFFYFNLDLLARVAYRLRIPKKFLRYLLALRRLDAQTLLKVLIISALRYLVFGLQYYFIFRAFGAEIGLMNTFLGVSGLFVLQGVIPSMALGELTVRGPLAQLMFSDWVASTAMIYMTTYTIWLINIFIPALIGGLLFMTNRKKDVGI